MKPSTHNIILPLTLAGVLACQPVEEVPLYQAVPVTVRDIVITAAAAGSAEPIQTVEVKSKASGEILEVRVDIGDVVEPGDLLVRVDQRVPGNAVDQAEADLAVAEAQVANAESQLRRAEALYESQAITEAEWENSRLTFANANAQLVRSQAVLEDARIAFEDTEVRARSRGMVLSRSVEVGTVIQSASNSVSGGAVLLTMANLDTIQVRTLVDETDIGKIQSGLPVTITVDAYPNQPFEGRVLKVEPEALVQQNVTMFPVLIRIANDRGLLRPGMNSEVEIHIASVENAVTVPNIALRTERDVESAAAVFGLDMETVRSQLATRMPSDGDRDEGMAMGAPRPGATAPTAGQAVSGDNGSVSYDGREIVVPEGVSAEQLRGVIGKLESEGFAAARQMSEEERTVLRSVRDQLGMPGRGGGERGGAGRPGAGGGRPGARGAEVSSAPAVDSAAFPVRDHIVFMLRDGRPTAVAIKTAMTDLDYTQVISGLAEGDSVLVLTSGSD